MEEDAPREIPRSTNLGKGLFTLHEPDTNDMKTLRSILMRPNVFGAVCVSERTRIRGYFILIDPNSNEASEFYNDLAEYCDIEDLTVGTAIDMLYTKTQSCELFKKSTRKCLNYSSLLANLSQCFNCLSSYMHIRVVSHHRFER